MQFGKSYDLFISHSWDYDGDYHGLIELLERESSLDWHNCSAPRSAPVVALDLAGIRSALARRIYRSDAILVVLGRHLDESKWVRYELSVAREYGRPIIGIKPPKPIPASADIGEVATTMADWTSDSIAQAIKIYTV